MAVKADGLDTVDDASLSLPVVPGLGFVFEGKLVNVLICTFSCETDNFTAHGPAAADADCIIDQATLSAMTLAVDRDAGNDGARFDLAAVLADV